MLAGSIPTVVRQTFQLARCGCTLRVTSQTSSSPEYITPTHIKEYHILEYIDIEGTRLSSELEPT
jgi:hypothetical protein